MGVVVVVVDALVPRVAMVVVGLFHGLVAAGLVAVAVAVGVVVVVVDAPVL